VNLLFRRALLGIFLLFGSCAAGASWKEIPFPKPLPRAEAVLLAEASAEACDFQVDRMESDPSGGEIVTLWKERLAPFGKGHRLKLHVRLQPGEEGKVRGLEFYVERQVNESMEAPFAPRPEDWGNGGQDPGAEALFETHVATRLRSYFQGSWKGGEKPPKRSLFPDR